MTQSKQVCPECKGKTLILSRNMDESEAGLMVACPHCNGTGSIPIRWVRLAEDQSTPFEFLKNGFMGMPETTGFVLTKLYEAGFRKVNKENL